MLRTAKHVYISTAPWIVPLPARRASAKAAREIRRCVRYFRKNGADNATFGRVKLTIPLCVCKTSQMHSNQGPLAKRLVYLVW